VRANHGDTSQTHEKHNGVVTPTSNWGGKEKGVSSVGFGGKDSVGARHQTVSHGPPRSQTELLAFVSRRHKVSGAPADMAWP